MWGNSYFPPQNLMQNMFLLDSAACFDVETFKSRSQRRGRWRLGGVGFFFFKVGDEVFLSDCFWCPVCWWEQAAPSLPSRLSRTVWLWHFTLAQQSRPVTVCRLHSQLLVCGPRLCCLANYEYSSTMRVILSDTQLSGHIVSGLLFGGREGETSARTWPLSRCTYHVWCQKLTVRWPKYSILDISSFPCLCLNQSWYRRPVLLSKSICDHERASRFKSVVHTLYRWRKHPKTNIMCICGSRQKHLGLVDFHHHPHPALSPPKKQNNSLQFLGLRGVKDDYTQWVEPLT